MPIFLNAGGVATDGSSRDDIVRAMAQFQAKVALDPVTSLTNNIGGTPSATYAVTTVAATVTNTAASGSSLAGKASTEAAMETVKDALVELFTTANAAAAKVGYSAITYNGGGTAADGTAAAVTVATTGAATGVPAAAFNTWIAATNEALYNLTILTNKVARAAGLPVLVPNYSGTVVSTVASISTSTGTAVDPGVTKVAADAALTAFRTNLTTIATRLNALVAGPTAAPVITQ